MECGALFLSRRQKPCCLTCNFPDVRKVTRLSCSILWSGGMRLRRMGNERNYLLRTVIPTSRDWPHEPARSLHFGRDDNCLYQSLGRDDSSLHRSQGILGFNEVLAVKVSRITIIFLSLLFAFAAAAQTPPPDASLTENPAYQKNCAKCHGKTAEGPLRWPAAGGRGSEGHVRR